ncbi:MAG: sulfotransferase [Bacteroidota bacterium]
MLKEKYKFLLYRKWLSLKKVVCRPVEPKYLFILSPPYSGSTLLQQILFSSKNVSANNPIGKHREGQKLPYVRKLMFPSIDYRWDSRHKMPWEDIKIEWHKYWDITKPILLEKSPPNTVRALDIENVFQPVYFICLMRNPYAICEGWLRRLTKNIDDPIQIIQKCLFYQRKNLDQLENSIYLKYEDLVDKPNYSKKQIISFLPDLVDLDFDKKFTAHNSRNKKLSLINLNREKIDRLSIKDINRATYLLRPYESLVNSFGYELL